jgi:hypothetical protein
MLKKNNTVGATQHMVGCKPYPHKPYPHKPYPHSQSPINTTRFCEIKKVDYFCICVSLICIIIV